MTKQNFEDLFLNNIEVVEFEGIERVQQMVNDDEFGKIVDELQKSESMKMNDWIELSKKIDMNKVEYEQRKNDLEKQKEEIDKKNEEQTNKQSTRKLRREIEKTEKKLAKLDALKQVIDERSISLQPKQSMEKVLEILENSKTIEEMNVLVEGQELTEEEKQHILDFLASDTENSKAAFELVANDIKNAPAYEGMESWVQQRDDLRHKVEEVQDAIKRNKDMLNELEEERDKLNVQLTEAKGKLGEISAEIAI